MTMTKRPDTVADFDTTKDYVPGGLTKTEATALFPEGSRVMFRTDNYGAPTEGILKSHTPHIRIVRGGYGSDRTVEVRPTRPSSAGRRTWDKAEVWANRDVGFLFVTDDGTEHVAKHVCGTPEAYRLSVRKARAAKREQENADALRLFARKVRLGALTAAVGRTAEMLVEHPHNEEEPAVVNAHPDAPMLRVEPGRYSGFLVPLEDVEALIEALAPGALATATEDVLKVLAESADVTA